MDDILTRMLDVERRAADIVSEAEAEAECIREQARQEAAVEKERLRQALDELVRQLITGRSAEAEQERDEALRRADLKLRRRTEEFTRSITPREEQVCRALAFPGSTRKPAEEQQAG